MWKKSIEIGIKDEYSVLRENGIETIESCQSALVPSRGTPRQFIAPIFSPPGVQSLIINASYTKRSE